MYRTNTNGRTMQPHLVLHFGTQYPSLLLDLRTRTILGRGQNPEEFVLDLSVFDAFALGVSRRHALLYMKNNQIFIEDLGSVEGTWLNDQWLIPFKSYPVTRTSVLRLGRLTVKLYNEVKMAALPQ